MLRLLYLIICTEQSPFYEKLIFSQLIHRILKNPKINYHIHKRLQWAPFLSQIGSVHIVAPMSFAIHFNANRPLSLCVSSNILLLYFQTKLFMDLMPLSYNLVKVILFDLI
jgi:hypothetical protein